MGRGGRRRRGEVMPAPPDEATPFLFLSATVLPPCVGKRSLSPSQSVLLTQPDTHSRCGRRFRGAR